MIKRVIIISICYINENSYKTLGIDFFKEKGFGVDFWCVRDIYLPYGKQKPIYLGEPLYDSFIQITDFVTLFKKMREQNPVDCHFILMNIASPERNDKSLKLCMLLTLLGLKYSSVILNPVLSPKNISMIRARLIELKMLLLSYTIYKPCFSFLSTKKNLASASRNKRTKKVFIHTLDYDNFLENKSKKQKQNFVVFIDEYYPFHPDYSLFDITNPIRDIDKYYKELCALFDMIEKKYDTKVVIAAHPSANYRDKKDYYEGRTIEYGKTAELIRDCRFALAHYSLALSLAILYKIPLLFVANDQILSHTVESAVIKLYSRYFEKPYINLSKPLDEEDIEKALKIDEKVYKKYKRMYIKMPRTPEKPFFEVVADCLKNSN